MELQQWSYSQKIWLLNYSAQLKIVGHYSSKVKIYIYIYIYILFYFVFTLIVRIFFFLSPPSPFLPFTSLSPQSVLTLFISSYCKLQFLHSPPTQALTQGQPKPLPNADNANFFILRPYLSTISFFLYSVSQFFTVSNTKTHDRRFWILILSP